MSMLYAGILYISGSYLYHFKPLAMQFFLRLKHWQLFILNFGIPMVLMMVIMINLFSKMIVTQQPDPTIVFSVFRFFPLIYLFSFGTLFCWYWAVNNRMQSLIPAALKMKINLFRVFVIIPAVYFIVIMIGLQFLFTSGFPNANNPAPFMIGFMIIFPLHLFSMFCMFYCIYFTAKSIKTAELQREVTFSDYMAEFFLIWFFFVGVWILQPRVNKMASETYEPAKPGINPWEV